jgi:hypothetical protein
MSSLGECLRADSEHRVDSPFEEAGPSGRTKATSSGNFQDSRKPYRGAGLKAPSIRKHPKSGDGITRCVPRLDAATQNE